MLLSGGQWPIKNQYTLYDIKVFNLEMITLIDIIFTKTEINNLKMNQMNLNLIKIFFLND